MRSLHTLKIYCWLWLPMTENTLESLDIGEFYKQDNPPLKEKRLETSCHLRSVSYTHLDVYKRQALWLSTTELNSRSLPSSLWSTTTTVCNWILHMGRKFLQKSHDRISYTPRPAMKKLSRVCSTHTSSLRTNVLRYRPKNEHRVSFSVSEKRNDRGL